MVSARNHLLLLSLLFGTAVMTPFFLTEERLESFPSICLLHSLTGYDCPSCGLTRSFIAFTHGNFNDAVRFHPAGFTIFILLSVLFCGFLLSLLRIDTPIHRFLRKHPYLLVTIGTTALIEGHIIKMVMV